MPVIGIGIDTVAIERMRRVTTRPGSGPRFRERIFTEAERAACDARRDPAEAYAARFAAKEATMKALGAEGIAFAFRDIEVERRPGGAPAIRLHGRVARRAAEMGARRIHVSLTHADPVAVASVVVEGDER